MANPNNSSTRWVWMDLEMTGLNEANCHILQIAMIITNTSFDIIAKKDFTIWQPDSILDSVDPFIREMHTKNGLLQKCRQSKLTLRDAEADLMAAIVQHTDYKKGLLTGNSMYIDRRFLQKYLPAIENYLHYRQVDVSTVKELCYAWYGQDTIAFKKNSTHTALEDIETSIAELKYFKANFFKS